MSGEKILIVEDEIIVAMGVEQKLLDLGYNVVNIVDTGEDAVKCANQMKPDLILMEIVLKGMMDGIEAVQQLHDNLDIPITYLTAYSDDNILKGQGYYIEFLNCPWKTEAKKKPVFCLNCQAIMNCSFSWTEFGGTLDQDMTIAEGHPSCNFKFH